jgi:hypothetical protein
MLTVTIDGKNSAGWMILKRYQMYWQLINKAKEKYSLLIHYCDYEILSVNCNDRHFCYNIYKIFFFYSHILKDCELWILLRMILYM